MKKKEKIGLKEEWRHKENKIDNKNKNKNKIKKQIKK